jgi:hypothetical protein
MSNFEKGLDQFCIEEGKRVWTLGAALSPLLYPKLCVSPISPLWLDYLLFRRFSNLGVNIIVLSDDGGLFDAWFSSIFFISTILPSSKAF